MSKHSSLLKSKKFLLVYRLCVGSALLYSSQAYCDTIGIAGGREDNEAYMVFISSEGVATPISSGDLPVGTSRINSVAMGETAAIVGGKDNGNDIPYAAFVSPEGVLTKVSGAGLPAEGEIFAVAINRLGNAIIGGANDDTAAPYAAIVSSSSPVAVDLSGEAPSGVGSIRSVAINDSGLGIAGGVVGAFDTGYLAMVSSSGVATEVAGADAPAGTSEINSVAINASGKGIAGGLENTNQPYAVFLTSSGVPTKLTGELPAGPNGGIYTVAINDSGAGIIGGAESGFISPYAAIVSSGGNATKITGAGAPSGDGTIYAVAINSSGAGIVGGEDGGDNTPYAALISSSGVATEISGPGAPVPSGRILAVAIDDTGVGLIGGIDNVGSDTYLGVVSPSAIVTDVTGAGVPTGFGQVSSVAMGAFSSGGNGPEPIFRAVIPSRFGPSSREGGSFANALFSLASQVLPNHFFSQKTNRNRPFSQNSQEVGLLADSFEPSQTEISDVLESADQEVGDGLTAETFPENDRCEELPFENCSKYTLWTAPFGDYIHQASQGNLPSVNNWIGGVVAGFDYHLSMNATIGCAAAYAYNHAHLSQNVGHADANQEFLALYGSWMREHFYVNLALWGGAYQMKNVRNSIAGIVSKSDIDGWLLDPHLEISTPFYARGNWFLFDPFLMLDWANNWQGHIQETGASGFNLIIGNQYTSLLRGELGLRFFEIFQYGWGTFVLQEKGSWVYKRPFGTTSTTAIFVSGTAPFAIDVFSNQTQNLGAAQLSAWFFPCNKKYPYGSLNYQCELGSSFQNHLLSLEIGKNF